MDERYLSAIRGFEGFTPRAAWDYRQHSNGYGTRAKFAGEQIDEAEAQRRFSGEIANARAIVERAAPGVDEGTKAALTSLTYNAGSAWINSGLGEAIRSGDMATARERFLQYSKAGGETLPGLQKRRAAEAAWFGGGAPDARGPVQTAQATTQGDDMDWLSMILGKIGGGTAGPAAAGAGTGAAPGGEAAGAQPAAQGGVPLPFGMGRLQAPAAGQQMPQPPAPPQMPDLAPLPQRQPIDMTRLAQIIANRSRLGV